MAKNFDKFNKFCNQYDLHADGIEEEVIQFLKGKFPKAFNSAKKRPIEWQWWWRRGIA